MAILPVPDRGRRHSQCGEDYTYRRKVRERALQWPIQIHKVGRGSDPGMKHVPVKQELEVVAVPR